MAFKEKRREDRYRVDMICNVLPDNQPMSLLDVSLHGASILGSPKMDVDTHVDISVEAGNNIIINIGGVVRNAVEVGDDIRYGIEFFVIPDEWMNFIYKYMVGSK